MCFSGGPRFGPGPAKYRIADTGQRSIFGIAPSWPYPTTMMLMNTSALRIRRATVIRKPPPSEITIHFTICRLRMFTILNQCRELLGIFSAMLPATVTTSYFP